MAEEEREVQQTEVSTSAPRQVITTTKKTIKDPLIRTEHPQAVFETKKTIFRSYQIIWYIVGIVEVLLAFRIILKILGAYPFSGFTDLIYTLSDPLALPFMGILQSTVSGQSMFEWSSMIAMIVYLIVAYGIIYLFQFIKPVTPEEVEETVDSP